MLTTEKRSLTGAPTSETTQALTPLSTGQLQYQIQSSNSADATRVTLDAQGRIRESWIKGKSEKWLLINSADYDSLGHQSCVCAFDYDADDNRINEHRTTCTFSADGSGHTSTKMLKDGAGNVIDSKLVEYIYGDDYHNVIHGTFKLQKKWDNTTRTLKIESGLTTDTKGVLQIESIFNLEGRTIATRTSTGQKNNLIELTSATYRHTHTGLLAEIQKQVGSESFSNTFEYDEHDRLLRQDENGVVISNVYSSTIPTPVALQATIATKGSEAAPLILGSQTIDDLGRIKTRTVNGVMGSFNYENSIPLQDIDGVIKGCSSNWDSDKQTLTEICPVSLSFDSSITDSLTTQTLYSLRQQALQTTDIVGHVTNYTYDAFGRLIIQCSEACRASLSYRDDGLLHQEIIEDLKQKRCMTVAYTYDLSGNELSRTFTCPGIPTHVLSRTLLADGRLGKSVLTVDEKEHSADAYTYDEHGRLTQWTGENKGYLFHGQNIVKETFKYDLLGNVTENHCTGKDWGKGYSLVKLNYEREYVADKPGLLRQHSIVTDYRKLSNIIDSDDQGRWKARNSRYYSNGQPDYSSPFPDDHSSSKYTYGYDDLRRLRGVYFHYMNHYHAGYQFHYRNGKVYARSSQHALGTARRDLVLLNDSPSCYLQEMWNDGKYFSSSFELRDAAGTVFASISSDQSINYHVYSPYGYRAFQADSPDWLGYKGEPLLPNEVYLLGNKRLYNPEFLSFQSPDDWSPFGAGGPAAYAYCAGDPINYHDPSGNQRVAQYSRKASGTLLETKEFRYALAAVGLMTAPFTGGTSLGLAVAVTGLAVVSSAFEIASLIIEDSDPELAKTLSYVGIGLGVTSAAAGFAIAGRATTGMASRSMTGRTAFNVRAPRPAKIKSHPKGLGKFGYQPLSVQVQKLNYSRAPDWFDEALPGANPRTLWGADTEVFAPDIAEPMIRIARRNSASPIHLYSGGHGREFGDNWSSYKTASGQVDYRRDPRLRAGEFLREDTTAFRQTKSQDRLKRLVSKRDVDFYNNLNGASEDYRALRTNLRQREIHVHDLRGSDGKGITLEELNALESQPGHHIGAFCFSRNDERWLDLYGLPPVTSYI
ncbi:RHS repeat-associated core domain-containing protein [Pseudomonas sp. 210_17 TE3656]